MISMLTSSMLAMLVLSVNISNTQAARVKSQQLLTRVVCKPVLKANYCPVQITDHLLVTIGGRSQDELDCIYILCAQAVEAGKSEEEDQCCKVKNAVIEQIQGTLASGLNPEAKKKLRQAVKLPAEETIEASDKPAVIDILKEQRKAEQDAVEQYTSTTVSVVDSGSDEECACPMASRGVNLAGFGDYKKSQLFSADGKCTGSHACNQCYHGTSTGTFGCCLRNDGGAPVDCAPEMKKPAWNGEHCFCDGIMGKTLKSTLYEKGAKWCFPKTPCKFCKDTCSDR